MEIVDKKIIDLVESEYNPREITDGEFKKLQDSIKEFGFVEPVVINKQDQIIGGHMRVRAAKALGFKEVPCAIVDIEGDRAKILNLALNRISGRWDTNKLGEVITNLSNSDFDISLSGFEDWELDFYNQGPNEGLGETDPENIQGTVVGESQVLVFVFDTESEAQEVSKFLNDGKYLKKIDGNKLKDLISQFNG
jgi:hypothetical protein